MNSPSAIQTYTGIFFDSFAPSVGDIRIKDIAHALSLQCRFSGHIRRHWSVAAHSLLVCALCPPEDKLWGLLHDATEAYLVDLPRPIKEHPLMAGYRAVEETVESAIAVRFGLALPIPESVKRADEIALCAEAQVLMRGIADWPVKPAVSPEWVEVAVERIRDALVVFAGKHKDVETVFLAKFAELTG